MVSLDEWDETQIKIKILLKGYSGTGKTRICTEIENDIFQDTELCIP